MLVAWRYRQRNSLIQTFDPRAWLIFYLCFLASSLFFWDVRFLLPFLVIALFWFSRAGVEWSEMRRPLLLMGGFIALFSALTFATGRGGEEFYEQERMLASWEAPFNLWGQTLSLDITLERIFYALSQLVRVSSLALMTLLIPYSLNPALYGITFRRLGLSDKIAYAMDLTMRFIPTYGRDFQLTMDAQRARGYELDHLGGGLFERVRKLGPLLIPVTIHSLIGSEDIIDAMDLRAFGVGPRTWLQQLHYQRRDYVLIGLGVAMLAISLAIYLLGWGSFWVP